MYCVCICEREQYTRAIVLHERATRLAGEHEDESSDHINMDTLSFRNIEVNTISFFRSHLMLRSLSLSLSLLLLHDVVLRADMVHRPIYSSIRHTR